MRKIPATGSDDTRRRAGARGCDVRDIAMNVALPERDRGIIGHAVPSQAAPARAALREAGFALDCPISDRLDSTADPARSGLRLRQTPKAERRIALILADDSRRDCGIGPDTAPSAHAILRALKDDGYRVENIPEDGGTLIRALLGAARSDHAAETFPRSDYATFFANLPRALQDEVNARWGAPERDPFFRESRLDCGAFAITAIRCGNIAVAAQPPRVYDIDPAASPAAPDWPPRHGYLAFYAWVADGLRAQAVIHLGKRDDRE